MNCSILLQANNVIPFNVLFSCFAVCIVAPLLINQVRGGAKNVEMGGGISVEGEGWRSMLYL